MDTLNTRPSSGSFPGSFAALWATVALLLWSASPAAATQVFHSGADDGVASAQIGAADGKQLFLYIDGGAVASAPGAACMDGLGDEVCGFDLELLAQGGLSLTSFTPDPGADIMIDLNGAILRVNGLDSLAPTARRASARYSSMPRSGRRSRSTPARSSLQISAARR